MSKIGFTIMSKITILLMFGLIFSLLAPFPELYAKKASNNKKKHKKIRRSYNPEKTKKEALEILNSSNAGYLVKLANNEISELADDNVIIDSLILDLGEDPIELELEDDKPVDLEVFRAMYVSYVEGDDILTAGTTFAGMSKKKIMEVILDWLGTPYYFGGTSNRGIDCSAFTRQIFYVASRILLPRTASEQFKIGVPVKRDKLEFGDLVFFHTRRYAYASHVGIYLGDNLFAHSSSRYGVTVSSLESQYYSSRFIGARRLSPKDLAKLGLSNTNFSN